MSRFSPILFVFLLLAALFVPGTMPATAQQGLGSQSAPRVTLDHPIQVAVGIEIDQITSVDQKAENYSAVVVIRMKWHDPLLAFDPAETGRSFRLFKPAALIEYANSKSAIVPSFTIDNQQSNRWIHQNMVVVKSDGSAGYFEKSSLTLQAPHFDFTRYPFDTQKFYFEILSIFPTDMVQFSVMQDQSGLGDMLGEEEWILGNDVMEISTGKGISGLESARAALAFDGHRHIQYYAIRIFTPMLILIIVSWATFFLEEYRKRIEIAGANLLVFVAFNWMISDSLPKLGYLTFLDFILQWMFVFTGAIIVFNVGLRRLVINGRETQAKRLDNYVVKWIYPLGYAAVVGFAFYWYLVVA